MAVAVSASVSAVNDYQKEKQFRKLQEFANAKKLVFYNTFSKNRLLYLEEVKKKRFIQTIWFQET